MKRSAVICLAIIFLLTLPAASIPPARAQYQGGFGIDYFGVVSPSDAPIQRSGKVYTLTNDVNGSIGISGSNLVLNGNGHTVTSSSGSSGILLQSASVFNVTIENFNIDGGTFGIYVQGGDNLILNNTVQYASTIEWWNGADTAGIFVKGGGGNNITGNSLSNNLNGMGFVETNGNIVVGNNITGGPSWNFQASNAGIYFKGASDNVFYHNNFENNQEGNIYDIAPYSGYNYSVNTWDDGFPAGGNYWGNYSAPEIDSTGIHDTPYQVSNLNVDRYPLMEPFSASFLENYAKETVPPNVTIQSPVNLVYNDSNVSVSFSSDKEVSWAGYSLNGAPNVTLADGGTTLDNLTNGAYSLTLYANSTFGVYATPKIINFTVAKPTPVPNTVGNSLPVRLAPVLVGAGVTVAIVCGGVVVYLRRRKTMNLSGQT